MVLGVSLTEWLVIKQLPKNPPSKTVSSNEAGSSNLLDLGKNTFDRLTQNVKFILPLNVSGDVIISHDVVKTRSTASKKLDLKTFDETDSNQVLQQEEFEDSVTLSLKFQDSSNIPLTAISVPIPKLALVTAYLDNALDNLQTDSKMFFELWTFKLIARNLKISSYTTDSEQSTLSITFINVAEGKKSGKKISNSQDFKGKITDVAK